MELNGQQLNGECLDLLGGSGRRDCRIYAVERSFERAGNYNGSDGASASEHSAGKAERPGDCFCREPWCSSTGSDHIRKRRYGKRSAGHYLALQPRYHEDIEGCCEWSLV